VERSEANSATTTEPSVGRAATKRDLPRSKLVPASVLGALLARLAGTRTPPCWPADTNQSVRTEG